MVDPESLVIAIVGLGTTSLVAMYIAVMANNRARVAHELAENLGRGLIELSQMVETLDTDLCKSIDRVESVATEARQIARRDA